MDKSVFFPKTKFSTNPSIKVISQNKIAKAETWIILEILFTGIPRKRTKSRKIDAVAVSAVRTILIPIIRRSRRKAKFKMITRMIALSS